MLGRFGHEASLCDDLRFPDAVPWAQRERNAGRLVVILIYRIVKPAFRSEGLRVVKILRKMSSHVLAVENVCLKWCYHRETFAFMEVVALPLAAHGSPRALHPRPGLYVENQERPEDISA